MFRMRREALRVIAVGLALAALLAGRARAENSAQGLDVFRAKVEKWVETKQITSQERSEWELERETLRATRDLLQDEKKALAAEIAELQETSTAADDEREELMIRRGEGQNASLALGERIAAMEAEVLAIAPELPAPLQKKLEPLLVQIPEDPATTRLRLGQRLMNVLGVLLQVEKFNSTATFVGETRQVGDQKVQVRTLYWGLGQAVYVDARAQTAGIGRPGPDGWEFEDLPDLADDAARLLDIYEGNVDVIEFVELPVEVR